MIVSKVAINTDDQSIKTELWSVSTKKKRVNGSELRHNNNLLIIANINKVAIKCRLPLTIFQRTQEFYKKKYKQFWLNKIVTGISIETRASAQTHDSVHHCKLTIAFIQKLWPSTLLIIEVAIERKINCKDL